MLKSLRSVFVLAVLFLTFGFVAPNHGVLAQVVTNTSDSGAGSLRAAVTAANVGGGTITFNIPGPGPHTITLTTVGNTAFGNSALAVTNTITIDGASDPDEDAIIIDADGDQRHFYVSSSGNLTLQSLTLQNGLAVGFDGGNSRRGGSGGGGAGLGGAVFNDDGTLTVLNSTLTGNTAQGGDGGTILAPNGNPRGGGGGAGTNGNGGNASGDSGGSGGSGGGGDGGDGDTTGGPGDPGGVFAGGGGGGGTGNEPAFDGGAGGLGGGGGGGGGRSTGSTAGTGGSGGFGGGNGATGTAGSGVNQAAGGGGGGGGLGGAIFNNAGTVTLRNSTLSGNTADGGSGGSGGGGNTGSDGSGFGGGLFNYNGTVTSQNVTINDNTADDGGGIYNHGAGATATATIDNTIIANSNTATDDFVADGMSSTSGTGNLMETESGFSGTIASMADPSLGALADNGGLTETHALLGGSPAIDAGDDAKVPGGQTADQRGFTPRIDGTVDIGSVEDGALPPNQPPVADAGPDQPNVECEGTDGAEVMLDGSGSTDPDVGDVLTYTWREGATIIAGPTTNNMATVTLSLGMHTIELTVEDDDAESDTDEVVITVVDTTDPVITIIGDDPLTHECAVTYVDPGATATDVCAGPLSVSVVSTVNDAVVGNYMVTYTANDGNGNIANAIRPVEVVDTTDPVVMLIGPAEITLECGIDTYVDQGVTFSDTCDPAPMLVIDNPVDEGTPGDYTVTYTVTDESDNETIVTRTVHVVDTTPPVIVLNEASASLWPPNHKYHSFTVAGLVDSVVEACEEDLGVDDVVIASATSDEEENATGGGDGNTTDDIIIDGDCELVDVRAERQGSSDGRVYGVILQADDGFNIGESTFHVEVPHSKKSGAVEGPGPGYAVSGCTPAPPARVASVDDSGATEQVEQLKEAAGETPTARNASGETEGLDVAAEGTPEAFMLHGNRPNPFNPQTTIRFDVAESAYVKLVVYDMLGRQVRVLVNGTREAGTHEVTFEAGTLPSGTYLYRLDTPLGSFTGSMLLLK